MSVVAYKDGVMSGERMTVAGKEKLDLDVIKIAKDANGAVYGVVGLTAKVQMVISAIEKQRDGGGSVYLHLPEIGDDGESDCSILIAYPDKRLLHLYYYAGRVCEEDLSGLNYYAIGSGSQYAMGAMASGASAYSAVVAACKHDVNCGRGIDMIKVAASTEDSFI